MEYPGYEDGDILTFTAGENILTIYNAELSGSLIFDVSFSNASTMFVSMATALALLTIF